MIENLPPGVEIMPIGGRRQKILCLDASFIMNVVRWCITPELSFEVPSIKGVPDNAEMVSVNVNWERQSVELLLSHPDFPVVRPGSLVERIVPEI